MLLIFLLSLILTIYLLSFMQLSILIPNHSHLLSWPRGFLICFISLPGLFSLTLQNLAKFSQFSSLSWTFVPQGGYPWPPLIPSIIKQSLFLCDLHHLCTFLPFTLETYLLLYLFDKYLSYSLDCKLPEQCLLTYGFCPTTYTIWPKVTL